MMRSLRQASVRSSVGFARGSSIASFSARLLARSPSWTCKSSRYRFVFWGPSISFFSFVFSFLSSYSFRMNPSVAPPTVSRPIRTMTANRESSSRSSGPFACLICLVSDELEFSHVLRFFPLSF